MHKQVQKGRAYNGCLVEDVIYNGCLGGDVLYNGCLGGEVLYMAMAVLLVSK